MYGYTCTAVVFTKCCSKKSVSNVKCQKKTLRKMFLQWDGMFLQWDGMFPQWDRMLLQWDIQPLVVEMPGNKPRPHIFKCRLVSWRIKKKHPHNHQSLKCLAMNTDHTYLTAHLSVGKKAFTQLSINMYTGHTSNCTLVHRKPHSHNHQLFKMPGNKHVYTDHTSLNTCLSVGNGIHATTTH